MIYLMYRRGIYKIGISINPHARVRQLEGQGGLISIIHAFKSSNAPAVEAALHRRFCKQHSRGEWFRLSEEDLKAFCSIKRCNEVDDLPAELLPKSGDKNMTRRGKKFNRFSHCRAVKLPIPIVKQFVALSKKTGRWSWGEMGVALRHWLVLSPLERTEAERLMRSREEAKNNTAHEAG